jgi:hypothetical protein
MQGAQDWTHAFGSILLINQSCFYDPLGHQLTIVATENPDVECKK